MQFFKQLTHLIVAEWQLERKQPYISAGFLLYVISTVFVCYLTFQNITSTKTWNTLYWIIVLFAATNISAKSFSNETNKQKLFYYQLVNPAILIISKTLFNGFFIGFAALVTYAFYALFIGQLVENIELFLLVAFFGAFGLSSILTLISAISVQGSNNATLMGILGFPVILPTLITSVKLSHHAVQGIWMDSDLNFLISLLSINVIVVILSVFLFPYLWRD